MDENLPVMASPASNLITVTDEIARQVLLDVANTTLPLNEIAEKYGLSEAATWEYLHKTDEMRSNYARAVESRCHLEIQQQAELEKECLQEIKNGKINPKLGNALVQAYRMKADNAKWRASKLYPRIYGDRVEHNITGISKESDEAYKNRLAGLAVSPGAAAEAEAPGDPAQQPPGLPAPTRKQEREQERKQENREAAEAWIEPGGQQADAAGSSPADPPPQPSPGKDSTPDASSIPPALF